MKRHRYSRRHDSHVAQLILSELARQHLTRSELARRLGRSPQYITDILNGRKQMDPYLAIQLEHVLNWPALDFLAAALNDERRGARALAWLQATTENSEGASSSFSETHDLPCNTPLPPAD